MSCRVNFHVVRSALQSDSACRIQYVYIIIFADQVFIDPTFFGIFVCGPLQSFVVNVYNCWCLIMCLGEREPVCFHSKIPLQYEVFLYKRRKQGIRGEYHHTFNTTFCSQSFLKLKQALFILMTQ